MTTYAEIVQQLVQGQIYTVEVIRFGGSLFVCLQFNRQR